MSSAFAAPTRLLIGVLSFDSPGSLWKRQHMRPLCNATGGAAVLKFVLATGTVPADAAQGDIVRFEVSNNNRVLGTYLLTNRWFRWALAQPGFTHIARADDDAVFDAGAVAHELGKLRGPVVFGPLGEWYMWDRASWSPSCFAYGSGRAEASARFANTTLATNASAVLPRSVVECIGEKRSGPFPYAKGPLVAYSRDVAAAIVAKLDAEEAEATRVHSTMEFHVDRYSVLRPPRHNLHPQKYIMYDDVYYSALMYETLCGKPLTLLRMPMSEYVVEREPMRLQPALLFHKLKHPARFAWVANNSAKLLAHDAWRSRGQRCDPPGAVFARRQQPDRCFARWVTCEYKGWHHWQDIPPRRKRKAAAGIGKG